MDAALGLASEFSILSPNDDWDVLGETAGKKNVEVEESSDGEDANAFSNKETEAGRNPEAKKDSDARKNVVATETSTEVTSDYFPQSLMSDGDDAILDWLKKKNLIFVPNPAPIIPGEKNSDAFTRQMMQRSSEGIVAEVWDKDLRATSASLLVDPPSAAKSLNLEAKIRHREEELSAAEAVISARDKEILELKNQLKGKKQLGAEEEKLRVELAMTRSELEKVRNDASSSKVRGLPKPRFRELVTKIKGEAEKWDARADEHNELVARHRERREQMVDMQNKYNSDRRLFNGALLWTRENLRETHEKISRLEAKVAGLEEELHQARSSYDPEVRDYIQQLVRERDDARAEAFALRNALTASRADVARLVESERSLEMNMYRISKGIEEIKIQQESQTTYYKGLSGSRDAAAMEAAKEVNRLSSLLSQAELKNTVIGYKARFQLTEEINKTLARIEHDLQTEHGIVKNCPRNRMPEPLTHSSGPSSGGSIPSSQKKNPAGHVETSKEK
ncbi:pleckstrin homology domain-containing family D member 1-like [Papaver somniferum]|uniref:pleckstrin homology domain-containing family D member 1-like n=1 Tax=Papaver somniferum TaxID=3469 RepID=UPI000E6FB961|nr:pleckstrin homology domain-containing family D member 1-like [Papaver somniferum]